MSGNQLLDEIASGARLLGWDPPVGIDHSDYVTRATSLMWAFKFELSVTSAPWLSHAYGQEAEDLSPRLPGSRYQAVLDVALGFAPVLAANPLAYDLALAAPSRWAAEVALLARGRRRTGRAQSLVRSCGRIQRAAERHGVDLVGLALARPEGDEMSGPVERASADATRLRDDGRTRGLYLLAREAEIWRERESELLWGPLCRPRPVARRAGEGRAEFGQVDDEGWGG